MADLPIPFSAPMIRALIDGRKTQTRRTFTSLRGRQCRHISEFGRSDTPGYDWHFRDDGMRWHDLRHAELLPRLKYRTGDRLYVREHWRCEARYDDSKPSGLKDGIPIYYVADPDPRDSEPGCAGRFRQGMHMPRWASRLTLTVTDVRVERLQDISEADAVEEGIECYGGMDPDCCGYLNYANNSSDGYWLPPVESYASLWNAINGPGAWDANPWVMAVSFSVHHGNIDQIGGAA